MLPIVCGKNGLDSDLINILWNSTLTKATKKWTEGIVKEIKESVKLFHSLYDYHNGNEMSNVIK